MEQEHRPQEGRVVAVTGGGGGIGSAVVVELARQGATVVVVDPGGSVTGEPLGERSAEAAVERAQDAGGDGWASMVSITDLAALRELFDRIVEEHGRLDAVVNPAGYLRFPRYPGASQDDWEAVLEVHFTGYLNVLDAALPIMERAGAGRVVGFVSGAGLARTSPDAPMYGCGKRAVGALTWELRGKVPDGISVNAMSPIAATRMVTGAMAAAGMGGAGLDLSAMPQPHHMGPVGAYLASEAVGWLRGEVVYSAGSEVTVIARPRLVEAVRTRDADLAAALATLVPEILAPVEAGQRTTGGTNPRTGPDVFEGPAPGGEVAPPGEGAPACLVVADDPAVGEAVARAVARWGLVPLGVGPAHPFAPEAATVPRDFAAVGALVARAEQERPVAAVVVAPASPAPDAPGGTWREVVADHRTVPARVVASAGWLPAVAASAERTGQPARVVLVTDAGTAAGRTTAQVLAQLARSANDTATPVPVDTFAVSVETADPADVAPLAELVARLARADDTRALRGAELAVRPGWAELRTHPAPLATITFGGLDLPDWLDAALQGAVRR